MSTKLIKNCLVCFTDIPNIIAMTLLFKYFLQDCTNNNDCEIYFNVTSINHKIPHGIMCDQTRIIIRFQVILKSIYSGKFPRTLVVKK